MVAQVDPGEILGVIGRLGAAGSTAGGEGIRQAYALAEQNFDPKGVNRVILATDGDFNVGVSDTKALIESGSAGVVSETIAATVFNFGTIAGGYATLAATTGAALLPVGAWFTDAGTDAFGRRVDDGWGLSIGAPIETGP